MRTLLARFDSRRRPQADDGFTLIEVVLTLFVISFVLLGLVTVQVKALGSVSLAKERQQGTAPQRPRSIAAIVS